MKPETKPSKVTENMLLALRNADSIEFKYKNRTTSITTCYKQRFKNNTKDYIQYKFLTNSSVELTTGETTEIKSAKFTAQYSNYDWEIQTIVGLIQKKDELELIWQPDCLYVPMFPTKIYADVLSLVVYRNNLRYYFKLGVYIGTDTFRMINL